jgi:hypothetical protein
VFFWWIQNGHDSCSCRPRRCGSLLILRVFSQVLARITVTAPSNWPHASGRYNNKYTISAMYTLQHTGILHSSHTLSYNIKSNCILLNVQCTTRLQQPAGNDDVCTMYSILFRNKNIYPRAFDRLLLLSYTHMYMNNVNIMNYNNIE